MKVKCSCGKLTDKRPSSVKENNANNLMVFQSQAEHASWHMEHRKKEGDADEVHSTRLPKVRN